MTPETVPAIVHEAAIALASQRHKQRTPEHGMLVSKPGPGLKEVRAIEQDLLRATPPDGPCVWVAADSLGTQRFYEGEPRRFTVGDGPYAMTAFCGPHGEDGKYLGNLISGLAPGACQRFQLVPYRYRRAEDHER